MCLTGRLMPDFKTIADFRRDNEPAAIRPAAPSSSYFVASSVCAPGLSWPSTGSKFKAVHTRYKNFTVTQGRQTH